MDDLHKLFSQAVNKSRDRAYRKGLVGRHNIDTTISYAVTGRADFLYVTLDNKTVITAINQAGVPQTEDYPVLVRKNLLGQWVITDRDVSSSLGAPTATPPSGVVAHSTTHKHGGSDEVSTATPGANAIVKADADGKIGAGWLDAADLAAQIHAATNKATIVDADELPIADSAATYGLKHVLFSVIKTTVATYYNSLAATLTNKTLDSTNISTLTSKTTPIDADSVVLVDSAASNFFKRVTGTNLKAYLKTYFDTLYNLYVHPNHTGDVTSVADGVTTIAADAVTFAKMQNIATDSLIGRDTASSGDPENITLNATLSMTGAGALQRAALTGDVTASAGSNATTIAADAVTNTQAANMAADTIKGRANGAGTGDPTDLTATQVRTIINVASGADVTGTAITALATKTTPVDADAVVITDSAASDAPKRTTGTNFKAYLKTYFDTLYGLLGSANTWTAANVFNADIKANSTLTLSPGGTQDYAFSDDGANALTLGALGAGKDFDFRINTQDADGTDNVLVSLYAVGKTGSLTNYERGRLLYAAAGPEFRFDTGAGGTGTIRALVLLTQGNTNQVRIETDGKIAMGGVTSIGANLLGIKAGTSTNDAAVGGVLYVTTTVTGQVGAGPDDLATYSIPANTLAVNNQSVWFEASGTTRSGGTGCAINVVYGASTLSLFSVVGGGSWFVRGRIVRTGAATQRMAAFVNQGTGVVGVFNITPAETLSGAVTLKITGESSSNTNNDTTVNMFVVGYDDSNT